MLELRKICVVTGSRAEYGLLYWLMCAISQHSELKLQIVVTGMHLSPEFGLTYKQIEADGFKIDSKVEMLLSSDTPGGITRSTGLGLIGLAGAFEILQPDLIVLLGDRFEILAAAIAATFARIPIAHMHGGEATYGLIDEPIRHSITKMSHLHFTSCDEYRKRVIQLGEQPNRVFNVGALGIENIKRLTLLNRTEIANELDFTFHEKNLLVTFHPVTLEKQTTAYQLQELLSALDQFPEIGLIFTMPNADMEGRVLIKKIQIWVDRNKHRAKLFSSLGQIRYLSTLRHVDGVVGNSSSGLIEVPAFGIGTVNIGDRQAGRIRGESVVDCSPIGTEIESAIALILSKEFQNKLENNSNPYGDNCASEAIVNTLLNFNLNDIIKKKFNDVSFSES